MDNRYLVKRKIDKVFDETTLSVGEIIRIITQEKYTGLVSNNRSKLTEKTDEQWYNIIEEAFENELETEFYTDEN